MSALNYPLARFIVVGCTNFAVSFAAFQLSVAHLPFSSLGARATAANVVAYGAGLLNSFVLNRLWTFRAQGRVAAHALKFLVLNVATLAASSLIMLLLVERAGFAPLAVWLPLTLAILVTHYVGMKHWAFSEAR